MLQRGKLAHVILQLSFRFPLALAALLEDLAGLAALLEDMAGLPRFLKDMASVTTLLEAMACVKATTI